MITAIDLIVAALAGAAWRELFQFIYQVICRFHDGQ